MTIAFLAGEEQQLWLARLRAAMPDQDIRLIAEIDRPEAVEIAILANPDASQLRRLPNLRWVQSLWAGVEKLLAAPELAQIPIVRLVDPELGRAMAEAVLAWTLYLHRDMPAYARQQARGEWRPRPYIRPQERVIGILGFGTLGEAAARKLVQADFPVLGWSRHPKAVEGVAMAGLEEVLRADIVISLLPLTPETRHLLNAERLGQMKPGAALINFGRGAVIDSAALLAALDRGHLGHAVLDVFEQEPLPPGDPFWRHERVTVLPHISAPTDKRSAAAIVAENIRQYQQTGRIPKSVDRQRGY